MKQSLLALTMLAGSFGAWAAIEQPITFQTDFEGMEELPAGWIGTGVDAVPSGDMAYLFPDYSAENAWSILGMTTGAAAFSPSQFSDGSASDQWLITPEIEVGNDTELLYFNVYTTGNSVKNYFAVYVSENGTDPESFKETTLLSTALQGSAQGINSTQRRIALNDYAGKKIRIAFVEMNNKSGVVGFGNIGIAPYYLDIENPGNLESYIMDGDDTTLKFKMKISTPVKTAGVTVTLETEDGYTDTYTHTGNISSGVATTISPTFSGIDMKGKKVADYTLTIRPNDESYAPTVVTGKLIRATREYQVNIVSEEPTGTWCGYCPYGMAMMAYYRDKYTGEDGGAKFIPIAVHDGDPMVPAVPYISYLSFSGYPTMVLNRAGSYHPIEAPVDQMATEKSIAWLGITRADYDEATNSVTVKYSPKVSFDAEDCPFNVLAVVTENGVTGTTEQWNQTNNLANLSATSVAAQLGEAVVPYFEQFIGGAPSSIPASKMVYNDVARTLWPSFGGEPIAGGWQADVLRSESLEVPVPANVVDRENIEIAILMLNPATGEILASDMVGAEDFGKELGNSAVNAVSAEGLSARMEAGVLVADSASEGQAAVYDASGRLVSVVALEAGRNEIAVPAGLCIVRLTNTGATLSVKTMGK